MFAEKHYPDIMRPEDLDAYLSEGWYRMGQTIFTTHFLCFGEGFYSAVWVRLSLPDYRFRKSLRKIIRRNKSEFSVKIRKALLNREKEQLYQAYRGSFPGLLAPNLRESLLDGEEFNIYNTYEVSVYHDDTLIAASFFDLGGDSVASIMGMYHPDYGKYSLGFFTMLMEIDFAQKHGFKYYYPGYVVPGYERFDYKLRIGKVDYYDLSSSNWLSYEQLEHSDIPLNAMKQELRSLQQRLGAQGIDANLLYYPLFEVNLFGFWRTNFFDHPVFLHIPLPNERQKHLIAVYDVRQSTFFLYQCSPFDDIQFYFNESYTRSFTKDHFFMELIVVDRILAKGVDTIPIVRALQLPGNLPESSV